MSSKLSEASPLLQSPPNPTSTHSSSSSSSSSTTTTSTMNTSNDISALQITSPADIEGGVSSSAPPIPPPSSTASPWTSFMRKFNNSTSTTDKQQYGYPPTNSHNVPTSNPAFGVPSSDTFKRHLSYYIPILSWLPKYSTANLLPDILAGITVSIMVLPQTLAYSALAGLPPIFGLLAAFCGPAVYFVMGSSRQMSIGPEAVCCILFGHILSRTMSFISPTNPEYAAILAANAAKITLVIGLITLLMGLIRVGFVESILSRPVLDGFVFAVALLIMTEQLPRLLGISLYSNEDPSILLLPPNASSVDKIFFVIDRIQTAHLPTVIISVLTIVSVVGLRVLKASSSSTFMKLFPELLFVILVGLFSSQFLGLKENFNVDTLGILQSGFSTPTFPRLTLSETSSLIPSCLSIAILGFIQSELISKIYASKYSYIISPNRELVALGMASVLSSVCGGIPPFGSLLRSKINDNCGVKTQMSNLVVCICILFYILFLLPYFSALPRCIISALIFLVAISLLNGSQLLFLLKIGDTRDIILFFSMIFITFFFGVDTGVIFAFCACLIVLVKETNRPMVSVWGRKDGEFFDMDDPIARPSKIEDVLIVKIDGALHFANSSFLKSRLDRIEQFSSLNTHPASVPRPYFQSSTDHSILPQTTDSTPIASTHGTHQTDSTGLSRRKKKQSVIFDLGDLASIDASALQVFIDVLTHYSSRDFLVVLVLHRISLQTRLEKCDVLNQIHVVFKRNIKAAVQYCEEQNHLPRNTGASLEDESDMDEDPDLKAKTQTIHISYDSLRQP